MGCLVYLHLARSLWSRYLWSSKQRNFSIQATTDKKMFVVVGQQPRTMSQCKENTHETLKGLEKF